MQKKSKIFNGKPIITKTKAWENYPHYVASWAADPGLKLQKALAGLVKVGLFKAT